MLLLTQLEEDLGSGGLDLLLAYGNEVQTLHIYQDWSRTNESKLKLVHYVKCVRCRRTFNDYSALVRYVGMR